MLLDIDNKKGVATLHSAACSVSSKAYSTIAKPFGRVAAEGGWFPVVDRPHAEEKIALWSPGTELVECALCLPARVSMQRDTAT